MGLPDEALTQASLSGTLAAALAEEGDSAYDELKDFEEKHQGDSWPTVQQALCKDRTQLLRGVRESSPLAPYESLYIGTKPETSCLSVAQAFRAAGLEVSTAAKEPPEYIGCQTGFMLELCRRQATAEDAGEGDLADQVFAHQASFFQTHLGCWGEAFAKEMARRAETGFYRAMGLLLAEFLAEEKRLLA